MQSWLTASLTIMQQIMWQQRPFHCHTSKIGTLNLSKWLTNLPRPLLHYGHCPTVVSVTALPDSLPGPAPILPSSKPALLVIQQTWSQCSSVPFPFQLAAKHAAESLLAAGHSCHTTSRLFCVTYRIGQRFLVDTDADMSVSSCQVTRPSSVQKKKRNSVPSSSQQL